MMLELWLSSGSCVDLLFDPRQRLLLGKESIMEVKGKEVCPTSIAGAVALETWRNWKGESGCGTFLPKYLASETITDIICVYTFISGCILLLQCTGFCFWFYLLIVYLITWRTLLLGIFSSFLGIFHANKIMTSEKSCSSWFFLFLSIFISFLYLIGLAGTSNRILDRNGKSGRWWRGPSLRSEASTVSP